MSRLATQPIRDHASSSPSNDTRAFTTPPNNGAPITSYHATCTSPDGGITKTGVQANSPVPVTNLTSGKQYRCTVTATNHRGTGPASKSSPPITAKTIAARVAATADPGTVLVSSTVKDLVAGSGLSFRDLGAHTLRGVPGEWRLLAVD